MEEQLQQPNAMIQKPKNGQLLPICRFPFAVHRILTARTDFISPVEFQKKALQTISVF